MYQRGDKWYSDFWHEGKRYTKAWGVISKTVAKEKDRKFRTEVLEGKHGLKAKRVYKIFSILRRGGKVSGICPAE